MAEEKQKTKEDIDVINQYTGEKWYYTDIVKDHFFHPRNLLWERPKDENEYSAHGMVGSPACVSPTTPIQKNPNTVPMEEVEITTNVLSHDGGFYPVQRIFRHRYEGEIIEIKNQLGELKATPDHLIYALHVPRTPKSPFVHTKYKLKLAPSWMHASELQKGDMVLYPIPKKIVQVDEMPLPKFQKKKFDFNSRALPSTLPINEETLELFGYFVAEGHTRKNRKSLGFTFGAHEAHYAERVALLLRKYFNLHASISLRQQQHR
ncbi:MAG: hypothetical protein AAB904_01655, partial [Patescibacteria group bacterium]